MKLGTNSACDLRAVSLFPPGSGGGRASAPPASSAASAGNPPQAALSQQQAFSLPPPKQPRPSESEALVDQTLHRPTPVRHQGFGLHDDSSKRMPPFPPSSASRAQEEPQQQQPVIMSKSTIPRWNPSPTDTRCSISTGRVNEDAERRFQQLSGSVDKAGMVLDSVQTDVIQLNRTMKEAALDSGTVQQKFDPLEDSLQKIIKGQNDLKVLAENITKSNPDQLNVLNSHTSKLNEMSLVVSVCPEQVQADLRQLHGDIFRVLTKDTEGVVRDIRSLSTRPAVMPMLPDQSFSPNERPQRNQVVVKGSPLINGMSVANGRPTMNRTPVANGRPLRNQTPVANGSPMIINRTPEGNGRSQLKQTPVTNGTPQRDLTPEMNGRPRKDQIPVANGSLPARSTFATRASVLRPNVEQGMVKAAHMVGTSHRLAPTQKEVLNQKVNPQEPTKKEPVKIIIGSDNDSKGCTSRVILNMEPADLMKEAGSESDAQFVWGARKRRTENEMLPIDAATLLPGEGEKRRQGPAPEARKGEAVHAVEAAPAKRAHRRNPKYDATEWITC